MEKGPEGPKRAKCNKRQGPKWQKVVNRIKGQNGQVPKRPKWSSANRANGLNGQKSKGKKEPHVSWTNGPKKQRAKRVKCQRFKRLTGLEGQKYQKCPRAKI